MDTVDQQKTCGSMEQLLKEVYTLHKDALKSLRIDLTESQAAHKRAEVKCCQLQKKVEKLLIENRTLYKCTTQQNRLEIKKYETESNPVTTKVSEHTDAEVVGLPGEDSSPDNIKATKLNRKRRKCTRFSEDDSPKGINSKKARLLSKADDAESIIVKCQPSDIGKSDNVNDRYENTAVDQSPYVIHVPETCMQTMQMEDDSPMKDIALVIEETPCMDNTMFEDHHRDHKPERRGEAKCSPDKTVVEENEKSRYTSFRDSLCCAEDEKEEIDNVKKVEVSESMSLAKDSDVDSDSDSSIKSQTFTRSKAATKFNRNDKYLNSKNSCKNMDEVDALFNTSGSGKNGQKLMLQKNVNKLTKHHFEPRRSPRKHKQTLKINTSVEKSMKTGLDYNESCIGTESNNANSSKDQKSSLKQNNMNQSLTSPSVLSEPIKSRSRCLQKSNSSEFSGRSVKDTSLFKRPDKYLDENVGKKKIRNGGQASLSQYIIKEDHKDSSENQCRKQSNSRQNSNEQHLRHTTTKTKGKTKDKEDGDMDISLSDKHGHSVLSDISNTSDELNGSLDPSADINNWCTEKDVLQSDDRVNLTGVDFKVTELKYNLIPKTSTMAMIEDSEDIPCSSTSVKFLPRKDRKREFGNPENVENEPVINLDDSFDRRPKCETSEVAHVAVVRKQDERQKLQGHSCKECLEYYTSAGRSEEEIKQHIQQCSRHRAQYVPPDTPPHFWSVGFMETQDNNTQGEEEMDVQRNADLPTYRRRRKLNKYFKSKSEKTLVHDDLEDSQ